MNRRRQRRERGQVLPLFALFLIALFGFAALAIDVSSAYAARRFYRSVADAAALAGAQDLQLSGTRTVSATQYSTARTHAVASVGQQLGGSATCTQTGTRTSCTLAGTPYRFDVVTPLSGPGDCVTCDYRRSVQVNIINPSFQLAFAHALGFNTFQIGISSVAGLQYSNAYAIVMLRPPTGGGSVPGVRDITINGGTRVIVTSGDVGTNANMFYSGSGSILTLDTDYGMYYFDPYNGPLWSSPPDPQGTKLNAMVADPGYPVPSRSGGVAGTTDSVANCAPIASAIYTNPNYAPSVPVSSGAPDMSNITCYKPGIYSAAVTVNNGTLAILEPGLYFFDGGLNAQGSVIGGYTPNQPGVALVFPEDQSMFKNRTSGGSSSLAQIIALNAGTKYRNSSGTEARAALDYSGSPVQTNTPRPRLMTVIVPPDPRCPVSMPLASSCTNTVENHNTSIDLSGGSGLYLAGVQYAPSDNLSISGNATTGGYVGQVWGWTVIYTGGSVINQEGDQNSGPGTLRLDAACTAPGTACSP